MTTVLVPVKPFGIAKARLSDRLDSRQRAHLGRAIALHTLRTTRKAGGDATVVTPDDRVAAWSIEHDFPVVREPGTGGLSAACRHATATLDGPWVVLHADLPLISTDDVAVLLRAGGPVVAPSHDGGTNAVRADGTFEFSFGPGSFHRHVAALGRPHIVMRLGLAVDLDDALDLDVIRRHRRGRWIEPYLV